MKLLKITCMIILSFLLIIGSILYYAFKIEPYQLKLHQIILNKQQNNSIHLKIIQISDLHIKEDFTYLNLRKVVNEINKQDADFVLFTGDLYDNFSKYQDNQNVIKELQKIKVNYDKIAIWGNRDYGGGAIRSYEDIMNDSGFTLLTNEDLNISLTKHKNILFTGVDDSLLGYPSIPNSMKQISANYKILLSHEPDSIDKFKDINYDIILSGHSHGGQVNVPFFDFINERAISSTVLSSKYRNGMYTINNKTKLYVNTGIGTTHISARFATTPEIALFHIYI